MPSSPCKPAYEPLKMTKSQKKIKKIQEKASGHGKRDMAGRFLAIGKNAGAMQEKSKNNIKITESEERYGQERNRK